MKEWPSKQISLELKDFISFPPWNFTDIPDKVVSKLRVEWDTNSKENKPRIIYRQKIIECLNDLMTTNILRMVDPTLLKAAYSNLKEAMDKWIDELNIISKQNSGVLAPYISELNKKHKILKDCEYHDRQQGHINCGEIK